jgi:hypothetical protein
MTNAGANTFFRCYFTNDDSAATDGSTGSASPTPMQSFDFQQEEGKKSSFLFTAPHDDFGWDKPAHLCVDAVYNDRTVPFVLGGFEIVTNSRNIEIYVVSDADDTGNKKETYLTTCRGIKVSSGDTDDQADKWYKALLVIPGGPRSMVKLRLKLLSVRPPRETKSLLHYMKLKGRLPDVQLEQLQQQQADTATQSTSHNHTHTQRKNHPQEQQQQGLSVSDISAALAGVSMMVHGTEERITRALESNLNQLGQGVATRLQGVEQVVVMQSVAVQQLQIALQQQKEIIQQQAQMLQEMRQQQAVLMDTLTTVLGSKQSMTINPESSGPSKAQTLDSIECTNDQVLMEEDDSKPPSRMRVAETTTTSEEPSTSVNCNDHMMMASTQEGELGVDEDSKPPSRVRNDGDASSATINHHASGVIETATIDSGNQRVVEREEKQAAAAAAEAIQSVHSALVNEDDDCKPPSRPRADEDFYVGPLGYAALMAPRSEPATRDSQKGPNEILGVAEPSPRTVPDGMVLEDDEKPKSASIVDGEEEKKVEDDMSLSNHVFVSDKEDDDDDRPPCRSRQVDETNELLVTLEPPDVDETNELLVTLEPPDKGCGDPDGTNLDANDGVETDLIDFS